jgi:desulfoferrodoxin (superoxide reductase-like protein)
LSPSGELTVTVEHSVDNPEKHYISKITVYADNKILVSKDYGSQTSTGVQTDTFSLGSLPSGTTLKVEAFCVIMGSATGATVVP